MFKEGDGIIFFRFGSCTFVSLHVTIRLLSAFGFLLHFHYCYYCFKPRLHWTTLTNCSMTTNSNKRISNGLLPAAPKPVVTSRKFLDLRPRGQVPYKQRHRHSSAESHSLLGSFVVRPLWDKTTTSYWASIEALLRMISKRLIRRW